MSDDVIDDTTGDVNDLDPGATDFFTLPTLTRALDTVQGGIDAVVNADPTGILRELQRGPPGSPARAFADATPAERDAAENALEHPVDTTVAAAKKAATDLGEAAAPALDTLGKMLKVITSPWFYVPVAGLVALGILSPYLSPILRRV